MKSLLVLIVVLAALPAQAQELTTVQGRLTNAAGNSVDGLFDLTFRLYNTEVGGSSLWMEPFLDVGVTDGIFSLDLGKDGSLPGLIAANATLWLEIKVGAEKPLPRRELRSVTRAMVATLSKGVSCSGCIQPKHTSFMNGCEAGDGLVYNGKSWSCGTLASNSIPSGMIAFFPGSACPPGWAPFKALEGRVAVAMTTGGSAGASVGSALSDQGTRTISEVPSHLHSINPPSTASSSSSSSHSHSMAHVHSVNPPSANTNSAGNHQHNLDTNKDGLVKKSVSGDGFPAFTTQGGNTNLLANTTSNGNHSHTVNIGAFNSGGSSTSNTGTSGGNHSHNVDIASFNSASTGNSSVDVTMPYLQLLACKAL